MSPEEETLADLIEVQTRLAADLTETLVGTMKKLNACVCEIEVNRVLITMLAKRSGLREGQFLAMVEQACEIAELAGKTKEAVESSSDTADEIIAKMMKGGAREH